MLKASPGWDFLLTAEYSAVVASAVSIYYRYLDIHSEDDTWNMLDVELMMYVPALSSLVQVLTNHS